MGEVQDSIVDEAVLANQAARIHELLRAYDPALADRLLSALPQALCKTTRVLSMHVAPLLHQQSSPKRL